MGCNMIYSTIYFRKISRFCSTSRQSHARIACCCPATSGSDYSLLGSTNRRKELRRRGLSIHGTEEDQIARLLSADAAAAAAREISATTIVTQEPILKPSNRKQTEKSSPSRRKKSTTVSKKSTSADQSEGLDARGTGVGNRASLPDVTPSTPSPTNATDLIKLNKGDLQTIAKSYGLSVSGTKALLVERIMSYVQKGVLADDGIERLEYSQVDNKDTNVEESPKKKVQRKKRTSSTASTSDSAQGDGNTSTAATATATNREIDQKTMIKMKEALDASAHVARSLYTTRRILQGQDEVLHAAKIVTELKKDKKKETTGKISQQQHIRRQLTPEEAARVLEEVVKRKGGTGGVGLASKDVLVPYSSQVDSMRTVLTELKGRLQTQEESTQQLLERAVLAQQSTSKFKRQKIDDSITTKTNDNDRMNTLNSTNNVAADVKAVIDFAAAVGKGMTIIGKQIFNSILKQKR